MIIVDAHRDIAYDLFELGRDYTRSVAESRAIEEGIDHPARRGPAATGLPDALAGGIAIVGATLFAEPANFVPWGTIKSNQSYATPQEAYDITMPQLEYYRSLADRHDQVRLVLTQSDLDAVLASWADGAPVEKRQQGLIIVMEGADPIVEPSQFGHWWDRGVRIVGTSWSGTRYAGGTKAPGPLTDLGRALLREMAPYKALLDISHMAEEACMESLRSYQGPIFASHANPRRFCDTDRHLTDEAIKLLAERDGVMGLVLINLFWETNYQAGTSIPLSRVLDAFDYVCQLTGSARHVGIGSDWYAGMGSDQYPEELDTVADLRKIGAGLRDRGYSEPDIEAIMSGNFLRKYRETLPV